MTRVAIIGGGPSGSATALGLVRRGVDPADITVFDRAAFPRPKLCGGALTFRGTQYLDRLIGHAPGGGETMGLQFRCTSLGAYDVVERGAQWIYDRAHLDDALLAAVIAAGIEVRQETPVREVVSVATGWQVGTAAATETFDWVVGADGARGVVARSAGLSGGIVGRLVEAVYEPTSASPDPNVLVFDFDPILDGVPGYAWTFPYPKPGTSGLYKLGIMDGRGVVPGSVLRKWTDDYAARQGFVRVESKIAGWPEHYFSPRTRAHLPGLILVGEAWGIDPLLGEGIAPSFEMADYAAGRLADAIRAGETRIRGYERRFLLTLPGRNLWFQSELADLIYGGSPRRWLRVLFGFEYMLGLGAAGTESYGRLARRLPQFAWHWGLQLLRDGLPSNADVPSRALESRGRATRAERSSWR